MRSEALRKEKRMKRNNIIIGVILLFLMVFSMLAVTVSNNNSNSNLVYGNYTFQVEDVNGGQMATIKLNGQKYSFYTLPYDAISKVGNLTGIQQISTAPGLIVVKEPLAMGNQMSSEQLYFDMFALDIQSATSKTVISGISREDDFSNKKVYSCSDAAENLPVVIVENGTYTSMSIENVGENCYSVKTDAMSVLVLRDYIIYKYLGIIQ